MEALGLIESIDVAADMVDIEETVHPSPGAAAVYASLLPVFTELYDALVPAFTSLRRLAPLAPDRPRPARRSPGVLHRPELTTAGLTTAAVVGAEVMGDRAVDRDPRRPPTGRAAVHARWRGSDTPRTDAVRSPGAAGSAVTDSAP